ncbi:uncharacterized protein LOC129587340 [Paramacrobiotus metropolitanus]|uniref:uncharacterized protein LOC129587340 n=1 Tax=Paramacrobiotus metropolitanus TaxID=2943436 RepID=UPI002445A764|nr:uncharacterized protein LOC129587340 [Paramacrobiotus metropolitanus]XP_055337019.1 uncharacterized protein LOC129587340 [Paramacrobiotus metropolitanus]
MAAHCKWAICRSVLAGADRKLACLLLAALCAASWMPAVRSQYWDASGYNRLNPITYYGFTQPYYSGFYGGIGAMPYMSGWQASIYGGSPLGALSWLGAGAYGLGGGGGMGGAMGGFGMPGWNAAPSVRPHRCNAAAVALSLLAIVSSLRTSR